MVLEHIAALLLGFAADLLLGDPAGWWHPVRGIGHLIEMGEARLRRPGRDEYLAGVCLVAWVCLATGVVTAVIIYGAGLIHPFFRFVAEVVMCWQILALKSLKKESMKVYAALKAGELEAARYAVSMIVGRDTDCLDKTGIAKAAVETVAENTSDGVVAPFLCLLIGGPVLGFLYKAVNTMDSMVGYRNERYEYFGKAAARLDDLVNWIPARLSAFLMIAAAYLLGYDGASAIRIFRRDRYQHKSPNSAQTEAVCAGALNIQLAGDASYFGATVKKPYIGDAVRKVEYEDIRRANRLLYGAAFLLAGLTTGGYLWLLISTGAISTAMR